MPTRRIFHTTKIFFFLMFSSVLCFGQVIWTEPAFPTQFDDITVYFDASKGNAGLAGFTGSVYAHTGVITNTSNSPTDWKFVQGNWGTDDLNTKMTSEGNDIYSLSYNIENYYGIPNGEVVEELAFVFRNVDGTVSGRAEDGSDIYTEVYPATVELLLSLQSPTDQKIILLGEEIAINGTLNKEANVVITDNGTTIYQDLTTTIDYSYIPNDVGQHEIIINAIDGTKELTLSIEYLVLEDGQVGIDPPAGTRDGINYLNDRYIFQFYAPYKKFAFFLCPQNQFKVDLDFQMNRNIIGTRYWIELPKNYFENEGNLYQYLVDGEIKIADQYSEVILDPYNDDGVSDIVLDELPPYPVGLTTGMVTVFDREDIPYNWQAIDYQRPAKSDLVIYELLMRDFLSDHSYTSLLDTLDYLQDLGINAIELLPVNEFEGNNSWGYNPSYHMAVDKYYGSKDQLKKVIDEAHQRGIAVILDVVFNHVFSQSPMAQLYWDPINFQPADINPWLNVIPKHPFNVGYDVNHESVASKLWVKRVLEYWQLEFNMDGFRFDLSKGLTQKNSGNNSNIMSAYDQGRIDIINDYADHIWSSDPDSYVILEHFSVHSEEKVYADRGMLMWANTTFEFSEAAMGYSSNLDGIDYTDRGWNVAGVLAYMESHDEERTRYKIKSFGNSGSDYNTKNYFTSFDRMAAIASIYLTVPGPKMLWQFGEVGYDYSINTCEDGSINENCRLSKKPIRWDYFEEVDRKRLYDRVAALNHLKTNYPTFSTSDFTFEDASYLKQVILRHPEMDVVTIANTDINENTITAKFTQTGTWYDYLTGEQINVTESDLDIVLKPGEFHVYLSNDVTPPTGVISSIDDLSVQQLSIYPNMITDHDIIYVELKGANQIQSGILKDMQGKSYPLHYELNGENRLIISLPSEIASGVYTITLSTSDALFAGRLVKI